jgi:hypothetical protein
MASIHCEDRNGRRAGWIVPRVGACLLGAGCRETQLAGQFDRSGDRCLIEVDNLDSRHLCRQNVPHVSAQEYLAGQQSTRQNNGPAGCEPLRNRGPKESQVPGCTPVNLPGIGVTRGRQLEYARRVLCPRGWLSILVECAYEV